MNTLVVLFSSLVWLPLQAEEAPHHHHPAPAEQAAEDDRQEPLSGESVFNLDSTWMDQDGKKVALASLKGQVLVATMLYTSCTSACPISISDLKKIDKELPPEFKKKVRFVVFSVDPKRDTPKQLKEFMKEKELDPERWLFLTSDEGAVREMAAVFGIKYKRIAGGEFSHSNVISVLDKGGVIKHQQIGLRQNPAKTIEALKALSSS